MMKQILPLQLTEDHSEADIYTAVQGARAAIPCQSCTGLQSSLTWSVESCSPWTAHTGAGSWQELWPVERSPHWSRFSGRTYDPLGDAHWSSLFLKDCTPWKELVLEQFMNCTLWEGPMLENFMKDCILWMGIHAGAEEECEEEEVTEMKHYELITTPIPDLSMLLRGGGRKIES
ncbi:suppression of tumorigenicity 5 protein isoform x4 [Limosa lapponica baueri]|uniref:Suppression of tumorigenicity 5 protein isoform x4 n=1 Tax=Limosa lapponica baueri TaxID=1758121 RepID=A0A2I0UE89_LIMLA|nr:suppression of tumorigenicity 5 protein isoform x4 [Limosa lapponica baueri]